MRKRIGGVGLFPAVVAAFAALPADGVGQARCEYRDVVELTSEPRQEVEIDAASGSLDVIGRDGLREVRVTATMCASDEQRLEALAVRLEPTTSGVRLETEYPRWRGSWGGDYARIDLVVEAPTETAFHIRDGSGSIEVSGVGSVWIDDGSGDVTVRETGSVVIDDGSGSVEIEGISGDVEVVDGSGELRIRSVMGDVTVDDGSGGIDIETVGGTVHIEEMGSGGVTVREVDGDFIVDRGRAERIRHSDIRGELDLPAPRRRGRRGG